MGYYPPYFPDSYLQMLRVIPPVQNKVGRIKPVSPKVIHEHDLNTRKEVNSSFKRWEGKGLYFDQYV